MPQPGDAVMVDNIETAPYKIGYGFRNPNMVRTPVEMRNPFFKFDYAPFGPTQVKEQLWESGELRRYPTTWRRSAKLNLVKDITDVAPESMPDFEELGVGEGVPSTSEDETTRSPWGTLLSSLVTAGTTVLTEQQKLQQAKLQADQSKLYMQAGFNPLMFNQSGGIGTTGWVLIAGVAALGAYLYFK